MWSTLEGPSCPCEIICCRKLQFLRASNGRLIGTFVWFMLLNTQTSSKKSVAKLNCSLIKLTALLTFSWARLKDFWTRLAKIPAPAWRFGPALFSAIVRLSRELLCNHSDPRRVCFLSRKCLACASLQGWRWSNNAGDPQRRPAANRRSAQLKPHHHHHHVPTC